MEVGTALFKGRFYFGGMSCSAIFKKIETGLLQIPDPLVIGRNIISLKLKPS